MDKVSTALAGLLILGGAVFQHAAAQTVMDGQTPNGSFYRISVPDGWAPADGLVIWNHGFDLNPIGPVTDLGPLADLQLSQGYAVAASSYSLSGWALFQTDQDNREMMDVFEANFGVPDEIIVTGASLGGLVTAQAIEQGNLGNIVGAFPSCGALGGSRIWDGAIDLRLLYDEICEGMPGAGIPGGATGLPDPIPAGFNEIALGIAVNACTGVSIPGGGTGQQQANLAALLSAAQIPASFLLIDMGFVTFAMHDLVFDPGKLNGAMALENSEVIYDDAGIDAGIQRVRANTPDRLSFLANYTPSGAVDDTKIVSIHTDKDGLVIVENESDYAAKVPPQNLTTGIIVESTPSHCDFTEAEFVGAWESLRSWIAGQPQPTAADLQAACDVAVMGGVADGPCRYDPSFVVPAFGDRIRSRGVYADGFELLD